MKSDANARKKTKVNYKESWEDSEEESIEDIETQRAIKGKKSNGKKRKDESDEDEDFDFSEEEDEKKESDNPESVSMEIDEGSSEISDKKPVKGKKKTKDVEDKKEGPKKLPKKAVKGKTNTAPKEEKPKKEKKEKKEKPPKEVKPPKEKKEKKPKEALDPTYDIEKNYFYQDLTIEEINKIKEFFNLYFDNSSSFDKNIEQLKVIDFLSGFPNLKKGKHNVEIVKKNIEERIAKFNSNINFFTFEKYRLVMEVFSGEFFTYKPTILDCYFFPNTGNEKYVVNMLRTCKSTLDIAIFTLTNDKISAAILEAFARNVKIRIIADDECCKMWGSDVNRLAAAGIPVKTDNAVHFHMHHKLAIIDKSVVVTGSFNWTSQAVKFNQENILFYENKDLARRYSEAYDALWDSFTTVISAEEGKNRIEEELRIKQEKMEKKKAEKELEKLKKEQVAK